MKQLSLTFCLAFFVFTFILANSPALIVNDCINANENLIIVPNPANKSVEVQMPFSDKGGQLLVHNASGAFVKQLSSINSKVALNTSDLANGIYHIISIQNGKFAYATLIVKH